MLEDEPKDERIERFGSIHHNPEEDWLEESGKAEQELAEASESVTPEMLPQNLLNPEKRDYPQREKDYLQAAHKQTVNPLIKELLAQVEILKGATQSGAIESINFLERQLATAKDRLKGI